ncbi:rRNA methylase family protein [Chlamydia ibidis]|uniref:rRNA methylase family protein n=2 Tax=Chlamydia ibidis TaxID=1405396 RepID=S7J228_9CHLA|nr:class I SAM-dependent methyltransferase [Chlamydia ibidis]EPP34479.1 rRNA methylase family protein [Chlamydia ibidis]EQM62315.1 rRNA methylase family protein [Chlamydia ibidis 10-1398/6]
MFKEIGSSLGNVVKLSHAIFRDIVRPGDLVVDATCGNGRDSLVLARILQGVGRLVVYDIQDYALENARKLFASTLSMQESSIIQLKKMSHEFVEEKGAKLFHYNLGYLPSGDKSITTLVASTIASIRRALDFVSDDGAITVVCYPGHEEGEKETREIIAFGETLSPKIWQVNLFRLINRTKAPQLILFRRVSRSIDKE